MIGVVWVSAVLITCPPMFGWQEEGRWDKVDLAHMVCSLTQEPGYIVYSSLGSFFVPLLIMTFVYIRIFRVASQRDERLKPHKGGNTRRPSDGLPQNGSAPGELTSLQHDVTSDDDENELKELRPVGRGGTDQVGYA